MALKIRLARGGSKKRPYYRIVIADVLKAQSQLIAFCVSSMKLVC